ncbi:hypothetical protein [Actinomadura xylanilytica]|uniref:hypothetical protein n=1 Tax=Actinomadura xylanilytica TaxID=887459 RepID=UPI00255AC822|nr:hypothetical protein [Actinomadura xylanilytica]MDL4770598.1 hypothetical protein [Actinomadura xylanilytica]
MLLTTRYLEVADRLATLIAAIVDDSSLEQPSLDEVFLQRPAAAAERAESRRTHQRAGRACFSSR